MTLKTFKSIQAICATSKGVNLLEILFDSATGLITHVGEPTLKQAQVDFYYGEDFLLFAGMGDIHIHAREDQSGKNTYKEDFHSTCCAALNGGVVHVADMPNNPIAPIDDLSYLTKLAIAQSKSEIPFLMYAGIGPQTKPLSFRVPYKVYMGPSIGDLFFKSNADLEAVMPHYRNLSVSFHCEDPEILERNKNQPDHFLARPISAELMATDLAISLIERYHLKGKLCHYSAGEGLNAIRAARLKGIDVTCEVTPQHLYFNEEMIKTLDPREQTFFQMNPPIRGVSDQQKLLQALRNNEIDFLATDHAPHSISEKEKGMSGLPGLDTYAGFVTWLLLNQKIPAEIIAKVTAENPGRFFNQFQTSINQQTNSTSSFGLGMGFLEPHYSASFTILNLAKSSTIKLENLKTKAAWSPFLNTTFPGSLECVFLAGKKI